MASTGRKLPMCRQPEPGIDDATGYRTVGVFLRSIQPIITGSPSDGTNHDLLEHQDAPGMGERGTSALTKPMTCNAGAFSPNEPT